MLQPLLLNNKEILTPFLSRIYRYSGFQDNLIKFFLITLFILFTLQAEAQLKEVWRTDPLTVAGQGNAWFIEQVVDKDQNLIALGFVGAYTSERRLVLHKLDTRGNKIWSRLYAGEAGSISDYPSTVKVDSKGNIYVLGLSDMAGDYISFLMRYSPDGTLVWRKSFSGANNGLKNIGSMTIGADDALYLSGRKVVGEQHHYAIQKIGTDGSMVWESENRLENRVSSIMAVDTKGGIYVAISVGDYTTNNPLVIIKYDAATGKQFFERKHSRNTGLDNDAFQKMLISPSGNMYLFSNEKNITNAYQDDLFMYTLSPTGDIINKTDIGEGMNIRYTPIFYLNDAAVADNGSVIVLGINARYRDIPDYFLSKYNSNGTRIWNKTFNVYEGINIQQLALSSFTLLDGGKIAAFGTYSYFEQPPTWYMTPKFLEQEKMTLALFDQDGKEISREVNQMNNDYPNIGKGITSIGGKSVYATGMLGSPEAGLIALKYADCAGMTASAGEDKAVCKGDKVQLLATGGASYSWSPAAGLSATNVANPFASPETTTTYTVTVTNGDGCTATDQVVVRVSTKPTATITAEGSSGTCQNGSMILKANTGTDLTYQWMKDAVAISGATSATYTATSAGNYSVTVKNSTGCAATSAAFEVKITAPYTVIAGSDQTVCLNDAAFTLTGYSPTGGTWSGKGVTASGTFSPSNAGAGTHILTYSVTRDNCTVTAFKTITVKADCGATVEPQYSLRVFPNPTRAFINVHLELKKVSNLTIRLHNGKGRMIFEKNYQQVQGKFKEKFEVKNIPTGTYIMQFITNDGVVMRRVVVN